MNVLPSRRSPFWLSCFTNESLFTEGEDDSLLKIFEAEDLVDQLIMQIPKFIAFTVIFFWISGSPLSPSTSKVDIFCDNADYCNSTLWHKCRLGVFPFILKLMVSL